jgi:hypothetical protein
LKVTLKNAKNKPINLQIDSFLVYIVYIKKSYTHCLLFVAKNVVFPADTCVISLVLVTPRIFFRSREQKKNPRGHEYQTNVWSSCDVRTNTNQQRRDIIIKGVMCCSNSTQEQYNMIYRRWTNNHMLFFFIFQIDDFKLLKS